MLYCCSYEETAAVWQHTEQQQQQPQQHSVYVDLRYFIICLVSGDTRLQGLARSSDTCVLCCVAHKKKNVRRICDQIDIWKHLYVEGSFWERVVEWSSHVYRRKRHRKE